MSSSRVASRRVLRWVVVLAVAAGALWTVLSGGGDLVLGLVMWSLVAVPLVAAGIYLAKHDREVGRFFGGGGPFDGHGPD